MNKGKIYEETRKYIEECIGSAMAVKRDFEKIRYVRSAVMGGEYVRISDTLGRSICLDVTGLTLEEMLEDVCRIILIDKDKRVPGNIITDVDMLRSIAPLFREV